MTVKAGLSVKRRSGRGKGAARRLRAEGQVPAVLYGKDQEAISLMVDAQEAGKLFHSISVENTIVNVKIDDDEEEMETLVREIQMHPFRDDIVHVDFYRIQRGVAIEVDVPVSYVGTPQGVRDGGVLDVILHEVRVKCVPSKIPASFEIDISGLEIGDSLHADEIEVEDEVQLLTDAIRTLCLVAAPRVEEVEEEEEELEDLELAEAAEGDAPSAEGDTADAGDEDSDA